MLDQKDFEVLQKMMESVIGTRVTESEAKMDARIAESEVRIKTMLDTRIALLKLMEGLEKRVEDLEKKIA